jgi:hypothetical protein
MGKKSGIQLKALRPRKASHAVAEKRAQPGFNLK